MMLIQKSDCMSPTLWYVRVMSQRLVRNAGRIRPQQPIESKDKTLTAAHEIQRAIYGMHRIPAIKLGNILRDVITSLCLFITAFYLQNEWPTEQEG